MNHLSCALLMIATMSARQATIILRDAAVVRFDNHWPKKLYPNST